MEDEDDFWNLQYVKPQDRDPSAKKKSNVGMSSSAAAVSVPRAVDESHGEGGEVKPLGWGAVPAATATKRAGRSLQDIFRERRTKQTEYQ